MQKGPIFWSKQIFQKMSEMSGLYFLAKVYRGFGVEAGRFLYISGLLFIKSQINNFSITKLILGLSQDNWLTN